MATLTGISDVRDFCEYTRKYAGRNTLGEIHYNEREDIYETEEYQFWVDKEENHLMITRNDDMPVESWYDMWNIKNFVWGDEASAIEVYPRRQDLIDGMNMRHLFRLQGNRRLNFENIYDELCKES